MDRTSSLSSMLTLVRILADTYDVKADDAGASNSEDIRKLRPGLKEAARHARAMISELGSDQ